jgi:two-component system, LytTR family, sensor histidine kinase AlgZ
VKRGAPIELALTRLPRELVVLYLVAPLIATPVLSGNFLERSPTDMLRELGLNYTGFLTIGGAIHSLYRWIMPALIGRAQTFGGRVLTHVGMGTLVAASVAWVTHPLVVFVFHRDLLLSNWMVKAVVVTWTLQMTALVLQELRLRAQGAEGRLLAQQQAALRAQLEAIQSRTNPHFLFNAMNTVASLIHDNPERAERTLERLADVLRYALQTSRLDTVPLGREIAMVTDYLEVQRARFGDRMRYTIDVEGGLEALELPPLLLQPLVENAIVHGIAGRPEGGQVKLSVCRRGAQIRVRVEDDGPGPGASRHRGTGTSLNDLRRRLDLLYGKDCWFTAGGNDLGGFTVELAIPTGAARSLP